MTDYFEEILEIDIPEFKDRNEKWRYFHGSEYRSKYRKEKSDIIKKVAKSYYERHKEQLREEAKENYIIRKNKNPEKFKDQSFYSHIFRTYGLTKQEYIDIFNYQEEKCKICKKKRRLCVDHCHTTNKIRGLLCIPCNSAMGIFDKHRDIIGEYIK